MAAITKIEIRNRTCQHLPICAWSSVWFMVNESHRANVWMKQLMSELQSKKKTHLPSERATHDCLWKDSLTKEAAFVSSRWKKKKKNKSHFFHFLPLEGFLWATPINCPGHKRWCQPFSHTGTIDVDSCQSSKAKGEVPVKSLQGVSLGTWHKADF